MVRVSGDLDDVLVARIETLIAVFSDVREDTDPTAHRQMRMRCRAPTGGDMTQLVDNA